ncbi:Mitochondrial uncoupling protein 4 [Geodia barretti]|uniref:Mitochondrial uncoupling protein 4 n=2 Tax=Geodia barretti TaxID=519541 RepID=A0AA35TEH0_GEOBA|nr:Mitochondrial uncoupling protein 4 [Geodia barretti]
MCGYKRFLQATGTIRQHFRQEGCADRVKIILQIEGASSSTSSLPRTRGTWRTLRDIVRREGGRGLWKGWVPNCQRAALVCLGDLTTYDTVKQWILRNTSLRDTAVTHALSSFSSGLVSATLGTPADVVKSRMMSQQYHHGNRGSLYSSSLDCLTSTVRQEGFWALYKGFVPVWTRMAPWSLTFWLVYEEIRVLAGIGNF